jgi:hypothetical protein
MEVPLNGGMGYVVLFGGFEITGVFLLAVSVALQAADKIKSAATPSQSILVLVLKLIINYRHVILFLWQSFTGNTILTLDPATEIDELAPL